MKQKDYKGNCLIYSDKEAFEMQQNMKMSSNFCIYFSDYLSYGPIPSTLARPDLVMANTLRSSSHQNAQKQR